MAVTLGKPILQQQTENSRHYKKLLQVLQERSAAILEPQNDLAVERHEGRGKWFVRKRIDHILDVGSPFLEIARFAGLELYDGVRGGAGIVTGIGQVSGVWCMIIANDATVKGGTYFPLTVKKHVRAQQIAYQSHLPCIYLVDSGGAFLPMQDEVFPDRQHFGRIFFNQAQMSKAGIPQLSIVLGSCTAGGAYVPAMSDETIIVENQGTIFLGGPPLVKAATGEEISAEELGGAHVHTAISGVADHLAKNESEAIEKARSIVRSFPAADADPDRIEPLAPLYPPDDIYSLIPADSKKPFPMRDILARIIDGSELDEFKAEYGKTILCGFARLAGYRVGIVANDGILFSESALKAAHFIQVCDQRNIPLVFCQNIMGFMVGKEYEHGGIAKDGAKMVRAVACAQVPKYTIVMGGSFGAGNYAMAGRAYDPDLLFMWPNARIAVMGPEQAAQVLTQVRSDSYTARNKEFSTEEAIRYRESITAQYETQATAYYSTARLWDDGIIDPIETRTVLTIALAARSIKTLSTPSYGVFRM